MLDNYLVPEKSAEVSKPPAELKKINKNGEIQYFKLGENKLVNRLTSTWYLNSIMVKNQWSLGFLGLVDDDWNKAFHHFDQTLSYDNVLTAAHQNGFFNPYDRLKIGRETGAIVGTREQSKGLNLQERMVIYWADIQFMLENFEDALSLYKRIQHYTVNEKNGVVYTRSVLGEMLVRRQTKRLDRVPSITLMHNLVLEYPKSPSAPYLLELCALTTQGEPFDARTFYKQIYTQYAEDQFFAPRARYNEILSCIRWENFHEREKLMNEFGEIYGKSHVLYKNLVLLNKRILEIQNESN